MDDARELKCEKWMHQHAGNFIKLIILWKNAQNCIRVGDIIATRNQGMCSIFVSCTEGELIIVRTKR